MANLGTKGGVYLARFRFQGKEYKKSLKTRSADDAEGAMHLIRSILHRLHTGQLRIPANVDPGDFIVSGGAWTPPPEPTPPRAFPSTHDLIERYLVDKEGEVSQNYLSSQKTHLAHFERFLGKIAKHPCNQVTRSNLKSFLSSRKKIRDGQTVNRERMTLTLFYKWVELEDDVPRFKCPAKKLPIYKGARDPDPFKTIAEIEAVLVRGGLEPKQAHDQWDNLYLATGEIAKLLATVRERAVNPVSVLLHAIPAYTGMRRGELMRLRWADIDFVHDFIIARSRKQSRTKEEVSRRIDLHGELKAELQRWRDSHPVGQIVLTAEKSTEPLSSDAANRLFWAPMRGTTWCLDSARNWFKIGFHTYRHSFASNLAAAGVDQRIIDEFMGHQTEAMRKQYRHLYPKNRRTAVECFSLAATGQGGLE